MKLLKISQKKKKKGHYKKEKNTNNKKSEKEKNERKVKISKTLKNKSKEEKKDIANRRKNTWDNKTEEELKIIRDKKTETWDNRSKEDKEILSNKLSIIAKELRSQESPEQLKSRTKKFIETLYTPETRKAYAEFSANRTKDPNDPLGKFPKQREYKNTGIIMRSSWEEKFASWLDDHNIQWEYEPQSYWLKDVGRSYIPDFYLPELDCYIEVKAKYYLNDLVYKKIDAMLTDYGVNVFLIYDDNWDDVLCTLSSNNECTIKIETLGKLCYNYKLK